MEASGLRSAGVGEHATLQTIADAVGVSRASVSNAYNHPERLSAELRDRILATASELGYPGPDPAARRLRQRRAGAVGLVFTEALSYAFSDPAAVAFLEGLARRCEERQAPLLLLPLSPAGTAAAVAIREAVVDALCIYSIPDAHPAVAAALGRRMPLVVVDEPRLEGATYVGIDDRLGTRLLAEHVAELGHRRLAIIVPTLIPDGREGFVRPERLRRAAYHVDRERLAGFREPLAAAGVDLDEVPVYECANHRDAGAHAAGALLARAPRPTALLCTTDELALGAVRHVRELGLDVPGEVSVTGFDDIPEAAGADPPLTTVHQPLAEKGAVAGDLLFELLDDGSARDVILPARPVIRSSTGPPPGR
jgi:DNA-binding LacI/PurR family transcriptional regulator